MPNSEHVRMLVQGVSNGMNGDSRVRTHQTLHIWI